MIRGLLYSKELLRSVNAPERLAAGELQLFSKGWILDFIGVTSECHTFFGRVLRLKLLGETLSHFNLELHVGEEFVCILSLLEVLRPT